MEVPLIEQFGQVEHSISGTIFFGPVEVPLIESRLYHNNYLDGGSLQYAITLNNPCLLDKNTASVPKEPLDKRI